MSEMLPGKRNYTSPTSKTCQYWQQQVGGCQIILLPRRCYQQIGDYLFIHLFIYTLFKVDLHITLQ